MLISWQWNHAFDSLFQGHFEDVKARDLCDVTHWLFLEPYGGWRLVRFRELKTVNGSNGKDYLIKIAYKQFSYSQLMRHQRSFAIFLPTLKILKCYINISARSILKKAHHCWAASLCMLGGLAHFLIPMLDMHFGSLHQQSWFQLCGCLPFLGKLVCPEANSSSSNLEDGGRR